MTSIGTRSPRPFVIIGAMKAGTTSLHRALQRHPDVGMVSRKELDYFSLVRKPSREEYLAYSHRVRGVTTGEASPTYTMYPTYGDVAGRMAEAIPEARLIYCVRDPAERMRSHYRHEVLRSRENRRAGGALDELKYLIPSLYGLQLERYLRHYDPSQIAVLSLEALRDHPRQLMSDLFAFLGVEPSLAAPGPNEAIFVSEDRPAITPEIERLRRTPLARNVLGRMPSELKQRVGYYLPGAGEATRRARGLIFSAESWTPSEPTSTWIARDRSTFDELARSCAVVYGLEGDRLEGGSRLRAPDLRRAHRDRPRVPAGRPVVRLWERRAHERPLATPRQPHRPVPATPSVSVAMPLYEPSPLFLADAFESLRAQTVPPTEIVITDDSNPSRERLVARLADGLPVRYKANPDRLGLVENWNAVVHEARGTHVVVLHQDDMLEARALEMMADVFVSHPQVAICGVAETRINEVGRRVCAATRPNHRERVFISRGAHEVSGGELTYLMLRNGQVFGEPSALMFDRARFEAVDGFDILFRQSVDVDLALRMAEPGVVYLNERLVRRRVHRQQATQMNIVEGHNLSDRRLLYRRHFDASQYSPYDVDEVKANLVVRAGFDGLRALRFGRWSVLREALSQIAEYQPGIRPVGRRLVELALWVNHDAR